MPWLFPLMFAQDFMPALQMAQLALLALLFHIMTYPISFMPVSKGDTLTFALQETAYNVAFVLCTVFGYRYYGWPGAGVGMMLARVVDLTVVYSIARFRYGFHLTAQAVKGFALALLAGSVVLLSSCFSAAIPALPGAQ